MKARSQGGEYGKRASLQVTMAWFHASNLEASGVWEGPRTWGSFSGALGA